MYIWFLLVSFAALLLLFRKGPARKRVTIVVLGDIGRSPRMQYHALSFVKHGFEVLFLGYGGSVPHGDLIGNEKIQFKLMREPPNFIKGCPKLIGYILKTLYQFVTLFVSMAFSKKSGYILLQNPPAMPTLAVCWLIGLVRGCTFIIDWHNYGYTVLSMAVGMKHPLARFSKIYEKIFGRLSARNICVTKAMKEDLSKNWGIIAETMYDRPPQMFRRLELREQHDLFAKLATEYHEFRNERTDSSAFTEMKSDGSVVYRKDRPALLISSTSWTEDEDFSILLNALEKYEKSKGDGRRLPDLVCAITGKGPQKEYYQNIIADKQWKHIKVCTPWLEAEDYPKLLGSADVGVCMHTSTSGLDLPMKVVDMFGCGLPVCAIHFKCLDELVKSKHNGLVFKSDDELAEQLQDMLTGFPDLCKDLDSFRQNLNEFQQIRWDQTWDETVLPMLG